MEIEWSTTLLIAITGVVWTTQMVFTNLIMTTHVNGIADQPLMSSRVTKGYISANVANPRGGYQKPSTVTTPILDHIDGHYVRPNRVAFKYPNFKKDVDIDVHVKMFNYVVKANVETYKEYIINAFNYTLINTTSY